LEVVVRANFQPMTTDFSTYINEAKDKGATIVVGCMIPPDGIALVKQMKALGWAPKFIDLEKCGADASFYTELGPLGMGICDTSGPGGYRMEGHIPYAFAQWQAMDPAKNKIQTSTSFDMATCGYTGMALVLDAIEAAGSLDPKAINDAIGANHTDYTSGELHKSPEGNFFSFPVLVQQHFGVESAPLIWGPQEYMNLAVPLVVPPQGFAE
jgi:branched-chain amino acid transport system substrate-binding protein